MLHDDLCIIIHHKQEDTLMLTTLQTILGKTCMNLLKCNITKFK